MSIKELNEGNSIILKIDQLVEQNVAEGSIVKYMGYITAKGILDLLNVAELEANPRKPTCNKATEAIIDTLEHTSELMCCKSKGLLVSCSVVEKLERNRLRLSFDPDNRKYEDVLDGGHNLFAISTFIIEKLLEDDEAKLKAVKKIADWRDLKKFWSANKDIIVDALNNDGKSFTFLAPIEILTVPEQSTEAISHFFNCIFDISQARNNNVQLASLASGNQKGVFDVVKKHLPAYLRDLVQWTTGEPDRPVKGEYVLALTTLIFRVVAKSEKLQNILGDFSLAPSTIYSGRASCAKAMQTALENWKRSYDANPADPEVQSFEDSLKLLEDLPLVWDTIEYNFPNLYNKFGGKLGKKGSYGSLMPFAKKASKGKEATLRKDTPCRFHSPSCIMKKGDYETQDGYVAPLMYSITAFMKWDENRNCLVWSKPINKIISFYSDASANAPIAPTVEQLGEFIVSAVHGDPNALGKAPYAYTGALMGVSTAIATL